MAVSRNWGVPFACVFLARALLFGFHIGVPNFGNSQIIAMYWDPGKGPMLRAYVKGHSLDRRPVVLGPRGVVGINSPGSARLPSRRAHSVYVCM